MQDTSIRQYELLRTLTAGWSGEDGRTLFCVGDPMQSIYRFRDAEVGEFLQAWQRGVGAIRLEPLTLRRNFRSGEQLVHWFNTVFGQVMPIRDDIATGAISYTASIPVDAHAEQGEYFVHALFDAEPEVEAECTLRIVRQCLEEHPDESVAVLVRSRTQVASLLPALREAGINYSAIEIDRLTDLPEIIDLIALTRALAHASDRLAWLALLRGPWCGLRWTDIHQLVAGDTARTVLELADDTLRRKALSADGKARLDRLLERVRPLLWERLPGLSFRERVERTWCTLGGPAILRNEEQLENVFRYLDTLDRISVAGTLDDFRQLESRLDAERVSSVGADTGRLQIMTMHKAKGLQFDHVILPALGRRTRGGEREVLNWLTLPDRDGRSEMLISPVGPRDELESDPLHRYIEATEREKTRLELDRLLYVACTRAKQSLHLVGSIGLAKDGESLAAPPAGSLLGRLWPALQDKFERAFRRRDPQVTVPAGEDREAFVLPLLRRYDGEWQPPEVSASWEMLDDPGSVGGETGTPIEFDWVGAMTRHTGTIVHRWLHRIGAGRTTVSADSLHLLDDETARWAQSLGVEGAEIARVCEMTRNAIRGILTDAKGRWALFGDGEYELAVSGVVDGRVQSVVMDRIRVDDDGTHWIIDYKTSTHSGGDLDGFLSQEVSRYREQLTRYRLVYSRLTDAPVRTALYFPLLQAFREVEVAEAS